MNVSRPARAGLAATLVICLSTILTPDAGAQQPAVTELRLGTAVQGMLTTAESSAYGRGRFLTYAFDAAAGDRYLITMRSPDFDAYLSVAHSVGGLTQVVAWDDDGAGGTDALVRFRAPAAGRYLVIAQSLPVDGTGRFTLQLDRARPEPSPESIDVGRTMRGSLDEHSAVEDGGRPYRMYLHRVGPDERRTVTMRSDDFDAYLFVRRRTADGLEEVGRDDDGAGGTDARYTFGGPGEFEILASGFRSSAAGAFTLTLEEAPPVVRTPPRPIAVGGTASGEITDRDPALPDGSRYHLYRFEGRSGDRVRIILRSDDFDAFLAVGLPGSGGEELEVIESDDDGGGGTDSLLELTLPQSGTHLIRVQPLFSSEMGAYTLLLERNR
jgi:hypothetical protein